MPVIDFRDAWEMYRIKFVIEGKASWQNFWALRGVGFSVEKGETVGIIGENGSGKSTVLKLIAGMLRPDRGEVTVSGSVSGLLELGAGFQMELTGRENVSLQLELFGVPKTLAPERCRQIIDFAEIGKFVDAPVKCYSQGMFVRLAFATAVHMDPDIFLIDDILAVGDEYFQRKCIKEIFKIKEKGKTVIIVTHDMAMLQKLCSRTIFLKQGMLLRDGETSGIVSFYSQAVGSPKGIAVIEKKQFSLVFNNGRILLNWENKLLTAPAGVYTMLGISGAWYNSTQAEWDVEEINGKLTAKGSYYHLGLSQVWRIEVSDNYEIKWEIEIDRDMDMQLHEIYANVMLVDGYRQWFIDSQQGEFPDIKEEDKNWKAVFFDNHPSACVGVYPLDTPCAKLPSLIFEQARLRYYGRGAVLNSDYLSPGRILQYKIIPLSNSPVNEANRIVCFSGAIKLNIADIRDYLSRLKKEFAVSSGKLKLMFDSGRLNLFFNDLSLTKAGHMYSAFFMKQRWFTSELARWTLRKDSDNVLIARGEWDNLGVSQVWRIKVDDEHSFTWEVDMEVKEDTPIEQQRLRCFFSEDFKRFSSKFVSERFSDSFNETEVDLLQRCVSSGEVVLSDPSGRLPQLSFSFAPESGNFVKVFNSDYCNKARLLHLERVEPETKVIFPAGRHECFKVPFSLRDNDKTGAADFDNTLADRDILFVFNQGSGRFYKNNKELTKNIALYTSMRTGGRWYDSSSAAFWRIISQDSRTIKTIGKWLGLPLSQEWAIESKGKGLFEWKVCMKAEEQIEVDRLQANLMLSEKFSGWLAGKEEGVFPEFARDTDDNWDCLWSAKNNEQVIGLKGNPLHKLPRISFALKEVNPLWQLKIINSDRYHRGRILQYSSSAKTNLLPGEYRYFSGTVAIEDK